MFSKTSSPSFFKRFYKDPFQTIDSLDLEFHGFQFNLLKDDHKLCQRFMLPVVVLLPLICWVLLGSDSTAEQVAFFVWNLPKFILGRITFPEWIHTYTDYYGLGTHWSASVIYGLLFVGISKYLREKTNTVNSENLALTTGFVGLAIATFEFFWMSSYYFFQKQTWILTIQYPQIRIILQNILFLAPSIIIIIGMYTYYKDPITGKMKRGSEYKLNINRKTLMYLLITIGLVLLWWNYPFPTQQLEVYVTGGGWTGTGGYWTSSNNFPQTMYTIDTDLTDKLAVGEMFHIEAPDVHLLNNLTKIFWTLTFYSLGKLKKRRKVL